MDTIYITGHRNPDTDSIVSSMAYAALKNALGDRQYRAARLGQVSDETQMVLDRFGFQPPALITDLRTQVKDLDYDTPPTLSAGATISRAWQTMQANKISVLPVANEAGTLYGTLSAGGVANCRDFWNGEDFLVISGDAACDFDLTRFVRDHEAHRPAASIALYPHPEPLRYGLALTDRTGRILRFTEKPAWEQVLTNLINTGIYILSPRAMDPV